MTSIADNATALHENITNAQPHDNKRSHDAMVAKDSLTSKATINILVETVQKQAKQNQILQQKLSQIMRIQSDQHINGPPTPQRSKSDFTVAINAETEAFEADKDQPMQK